jgi:signal transduction histidine kinase
LQGRFNAAPPRPTVLGRAGGSRVVIRGLTLRALVAGGVLGAIVVGGFVALTIAVQSLRSAERSDVRTEHALTDSFALERSVLNLETGVRGYLLTGQGRFLRPYRLARGAYPGESQQLLLALSAPAQRRRATALAVAITAYVRDWAVPVVKQKAAATVAIHQTATLSEGKKRVDAIRAQFQVLNVSAQSAADARRKHLDSLGMLILDLGVAGVVLSTALIVLVTVLMHRWVVMPVRRLAAAVKRVRAGELSTRVPTEGIAEIGDLKRGFNSMAARLESQHDAAERHNDELESLAVQLRLANTELEQFASVASHDLREPLRKIRSFGGLLTSRFSAELSDEGAGYVERMCAAADRMETLIDGVLDLSRATRSEASFEVVSLDEIARGVLDDLQVAIAESGAQIDVSALPALEADALQMRQLLQNLIANALKFRRPDGVPEIAVSGTLDHGVVELSFADNGIGFEPNHAERIFGPFQRLHGRSEYPGAGLGLALCRRIAERHGGSIVARSTLGAGATFVVRIPVARPSQAAA